MRQGFGQEDTAKVILILKLSKDCGSGSAHGIAEIDCIGQVDCQCQCIDAHKNPLAKPMVERSLLQVQWKHHHHNPQRVGIENGSGVEHQSASKHFQQMTKGEVIDIKTEVFKQEGHSGYEVYDIGQKQVAEY